MTRERYYIDIHIILHLIFDENINYFYNIGTIKQYSINW